MQKSQKKSAKRKNHWKSQTNDTLVSSAILDQAVESILSRVKLERNYDIPYLAGYSRNGKTIYIDRHLPKSFITSAGRRVWVDQYLILHESVEKALIDELGLIYQYAHQIALRAEEAAVDAAKVPWREYDRFMQKYIKIADDERLHCVPKELDIKPYLDEHDRVLIKSMQKAMRSGEHKSKSRRKK